MSSHARQNVAAKRKKPPKLTASSTLERHDNSPIRPRYLDRGRGKIELLVLASAAATVGRRRRAECDHNQVV